jgi:adenylylsulfate kinase
MSEIKSTNIKWHPSHLSANDRKEKLNQSGAVIWLTGLSGSGKSTIATELENTLVVDGKNAFVLDGDNIRHGLNADLGFSPEDRKENIRRISEVAKLFYQANVICILAFVSPYREDRDFARSLIDKDYFFEVFCDTPLEVCRERDPKGLYKKADRGEIKEFTGISAPYEEPLNPELVIKTQNQNPNESAKLILDLLNQRKIV